MRSLEFEVKIGLFVLIGVILLTVITFSIGDFFFKPGYTINLILGFANGIQQAAPVRLAGIEVGEVREAGVFKDETGKTKVKLVLWLMNEARIEKDAKVVINTLGLIGEKYVEISPGTPGGPFMEEGDTLEGHDPVSVEQLTQRSYDIVLKVEDTLDSMNKILKYVESGQGTVGKLIYDDSLYTNTDEMIKDLKSNPWKLLHRSRDADRHDSDTKQKGNKGYFK